MRLADRYAVAFLPSTLVLAGAAWAISGDPVRALAVLVVATPCPLILAAPIAIVSADQVSAHGIAETLVHAAERRGLDLSLPSDVTERATMPAPR